ncbi:MAG: HAMP domain-containing histidine kinase, partial [Rhodospirillales bacterium]|nr:HAMP domain-containing histidine kinase [Rhodospirillales bacterium]
ASLLGSRSGEFRRQVEENTVKRSTLTRYAAEMEEAAALIQGNITRASALVQAFKQVAVDNTAGERCTTAMAEFLRDVVAAQGTVLRKRGIAVRIECDESLTLDTYPTAINQMLSHFIINSVVHGYPDDRSRGTITIGTALREDGAIELVYADDGIGIAPENLPRIFEPFFTTRRNQGSVGLGLNIVYNLVTSQLGGSISVSSVPDGGARFIIALPAVTPHLLSESLRN